MCCGESTGRSGKKAVNTSPTGLFPSLFPLQPRPPLSSPARGEVRIKTSCIWGCWCPCCTCSSAAQQVFVATSVLLQGRDEGHGPCPGWLQSIWGTGKILGAAEMLFRSQQGDIEYKVFACFFACSRPQFIAL